MNIIICGSSGMLGHTLKKYLSKYYSVVKIDRSDIDLECVSLKKLSNHIQCLLSKEQKTILINCVGLIKQRSISDYQMIDINAVLPHKLALICGSLNVNMIHFSTDCVYAGSKGSYVETDPHDATDLYGLSKSLGEPHSCSVLRTSIIGEELNNKLSLVEWVKSNKNGHIKGFTNHLWNGVTCLQAGKLIRQIIDSQMFWSGTKHFYSNTMSKYDLVCAINDIYCLNIEIEPKEDKVSINRTIASNQDISGYNIPNLRNQIIEMKEFYAT